MTMAWTCLRTRSSIVWTWMAGSPVCGTTHWKSTPSSFAFWSAPIRQSSKKGWTSFGTSATEIFVPAGTGVTVIVGAGPRQPAVGVASWASARHYA
ncbi:MAG: hypothetical protein QOF33_3121, partial [Thermomicrobiales bacterium]|nr:hypothetical protein [Thermomicrobiales bacterium]